MKLRFLNAAVLILFSAALAAAQNAPQAVVETPSHDFGEVKTGTPLKWIFKIKNTGSADLVIQNVAPS